MNYDDNFILQKSVNWSLLNEGLAIPVSVCSHFHAWDSSLLKHGACKPIKIFIDGEFYDAILKNQNIDQQRFAGHRDIIQIRYTPNSIASKLRAYFQKSYEYLYAQRQLPENRHRQIPLPDNIHEYFRLYLTSSPDVLSMECCTDSDYKQLVNTLSIVPEEVYEASDDDKFFLADKQASIEEKQQLVKYRKLDRSIIRMLKKFYSYRDGVVAKRLVSSMAIVWSRHITSTTSPVRRTTIPRTSLSSVQIATVSSTRTTRTSTARSSSLSSRMSKC